MRAKLQKLIEHLRSSYWFIPAVMAVSAFVVSLVTIAIDGWIGPEWLDSISFIQASRPDGARSVLTAIGGSMIGVAGTVFSVTMAAVVYASGQYGPRLLTNFLSDRGNQITLGMFTATFVFSMMVLRTIQSPEESNNALTTATGGFVPNLALLLCIVMALSSIAVLIYFIHHVPTRIHISNVIEGIGYTLIASIDDRFPRYIGQGAQDRETADAIRWQLPACFDGDDAHDRDEPEFAEVTARSIGYIQFLDDATLLWAARKHTLIVRLNVRPGSFVFDGAVLFDVWPAERLTRDAADDLLSAVATGARRTPANDMLFLFDELVEIAGRALSPGVNDSFTALTCMDWLGAAIADIATREMPDPLRADEDGKLCIVTEPLSLKGYLHQSFGAIREYAAGDKIAAVHFLQTLELVARHCKDEAAIEVLRQEAGNLVVLSRALLTGAALGEIESEFTVFQRVLLNPQRRRPFPDLPNIASRLPLAAPTDDPTGEKEDPVLPPTAGDQSSA